MHSLLYLFWRAVVCKVWHDDGGVNHDGRGVTVGVNLLFQHDGLVLESPANAANLCVDGGTQESHAAQVQPSLFVHMTLALVPFVLRS